MERKKRWYRSWKLNMTKEEVQQIIAAAPTPTEYDRCIFDGPYTPADTEDLSGQTLTLRTEAHIYSFRIVSGKEICFAENGGPETSCYGHVKTMDGEVYFINHLAPGSDTARQITLMADMKTGCATVCDAVIGTEHSSRDVGRVFRFGRLDGSFPEEGQLHHFTNDLVGKAAIWDYGDGGVEVKHIYNSNQWYTYTMDSPNGTWMASNPADFIKLRDNLYMFSFVEERQPGLQMLLMIDFEKMHDVGCCWGINGRDKFFSACVGAIGKMVEPFTVF